MTLHSRPAAARRSPWAARLALLALAAPAPAAACIFPPPPPRLPHESQPLYDARLKSTASAQGDEERRNFQIALRTQSAGSFIGIVERRTAIRMEAKLPGFAVVVRPLKTLSGAAPTSAIELRDQRLTSCGVEGGGTATRAVVGEYVIVFRDMSFGGQPPRQNYGLRAQELRDTTLIDALTTFALAAAKASATR